MSLTWNVSPAFCHRFLWASTGGKTPFYPGVGFASWALFGIFEIGLVIEVHSSLPLTGWGCWVDVWTFFGVSPLVGLGG